MKRSMADRAAAILSGVMLPLASSAMPRLTGVRSLLKCEISCRRPFSKIVKSSLVSDATTRPSSSVTVAVTFTRSTPLLKRNASWACVTSPPHAVTSTTAVTTARELTM